MNANPLDYQAHINYITALKHSKDLTALRIARQKLSETFPLSEGTMRWPYLTLGIDPYCVLELWLEWTIEELGGAQGKEDAQRVAELCERALNERYCSYSSVGRSMR